MFSRHPNPNPNAKAEVFSLSREVKKEGVVERAKVELEVQYVKSLNPES